MPSLVHDALVVPYVRRFLRSGDIRDPERLRRAFRSSRTPVRVPRGWTMDTVSAPFPVYGYGEGRPLLYLHGGGYTGDIDGRHFLVTGRIARRLGVRVLMPQYPLAPEHTWRDSHAALVSYAAGLGEFLMAGDSAGGGYALSIAQGLRDAGAGQPERMLLIAPWVDLRAQTPGIEEAAAYDPWLRLDWCHLYAGWWAGSAADLARPEVSPALGSLEGLAPTLTLCGTRDLLFPENRALAARALAAGWDYTLQQGPGLIHVYPILPIPEARPALRQICIFLATGATH